MTKMQDRNAKIAIIKRRCNLQVSAAKKAVEATYERQASTERLLESMSCVRNMSELEMRKENLPSWYTGASVSHFCKGNHGGLTIPEFSSKLDSLFDQIKAAENKVYHYVGDGMVYYERFLRPGHKRSEFRDDWYNPLCRWEYQFHNRTLEETTYSMIMENSAEEIFDMIRNGKIKYLKQ